MNESSLIKKILADIRVEAASEFDRNFERQAFFSEAWQRRKSPSRSQRGTLINTGALRRSITSKSDDTSITFYTTLPYAAIHNEGGEIQVTPRMKAFFWHKYYETTGGFKRKKDGSLSGSKAQMQLSSEAEFWKHLALMKVGKTIKIPRRRFLGASPELEQMVKRIIEHHLELYSKSIIDHLKKNV